MGIISKDISLRLLAKRPDETPCLVAISNHYAVDEAMDIGARWKKRADSAGFLIRDGINKLLYQSLYSWGLKSYIDVDLRMVNRVLK